MLRGEPRGMPYDGMAHRVPRSMPQEPPHYRLQRVGEHHKIAHASCQSVVLNRKKFYATIDTLGDEVSSTPMTSDEVAKHCTIMMTFDKEQFTQLQLTIPIRCSITY